MADIGLAVVCRDCGQELLVYWISKSSGDAVMKVAPCSKCVAARFASGMTITTGSAPPPAYDDKPLRKELSELVHGEINRTQSIFDGRVSGCEREVREMRNWFTGAITKVRNACKAKHPAAPAKKGKPCKKPR